MCSQWLYRYGITTKKQEKKKEPNRNIRLKKYNNWSEKFITWAQQQVGEDRESSQ